MRIYKYEMTDVWETNRLMMKRGAKPLLVKAQHGVLCMWVVVDPTEDDVEHDVHIVGTGHLFSFTGFKYVDTFFDADDSLVWHVFIGSGYGSTGGATTDEI